MLSDNRVQVLVSDSRAVAKGHSTMLRHTSVAKRNSANKNNSNIKAPAKKTIGNAKKTIGNEHFKYIFFRWPLVSTFYIVRHFVQKVFLAKIIPLLFPSDSELSRKSQPCSYAVGRCSDGVS